MKMNKIKDFYINHKYVLFMSVLTTLILLANLFKPLWFIAIPFLLFFFATSNFGEQMAYLVYLSVLSGVSEIYVSAMLACLLVMTVKYVVDVKNGKQKLFKIQLFLTLGIALVFSLIVGTVNDRGFYNWALCVGLLLFAYLLFVYAKEINVKKCFDFLFVAMLVSVVVGVACMGTGLLQEKIYPFDGEYYRLRLFTLNVNHLSMFCMFGICYVVYTLFNHVMENDFTFLKTKQFWPEAAKFVTFTVFGVLSMSKAFLLVFALVFVYVVMMLAIKLKWKSLYAIVPLALCLCVVAFVFKGFVSDLISRFFVYNKWGSTLSKIFTGRTDIWAEYLTYWSGSVWRVLFGVGFMTADVVYAGPHNVLIFLLYRLGVVGIAALVTLFAFYAKDANSKVKITLSNCLLFAIWLVFALEEMILSDRFVLFLVFGILLMLKPKQENTQKIEKENKKIVTEGNNL